MPVSCFQFHQFPTMHEAYTEMFQLLLKQGKTHLEAYREFDEEKLRKALLDSLDSGPPGKRNLALLDLMALAGMEKADEADREQCFELWSQGWTSEKVTPDSRPMSWYWRSPPKGKRPLGRRYLSTNQAWLAMRRRLGLTTDGSR